MPEWKRAVGSSSSGASKTRQSKRQVSKETFHKWQWTYEREHQSMTMACWPTYVLKWAIKASHLCLRFGALFVGSMRLEYVGSKTSSGHGPIVQATIKQATSPTMPTASHTMQLWFTCVFSHVIVYTVHYYCTMYSGGSRIFEMGGSSVIHRKQRSTPIIGGSGGMLPPPKFLDFWPSEIASGAIWEQNSDHLTALKLFGI